MQYGEHQAVKIENLEAYELIEERPVEDVNAVSYYFQHKKSGARVAVLSNDDENKVFMIGFRTPPDNSTGLPHILEHSVLCGSEHFPSKDPFVELVKGSLNTFLNAMTYPDKTVYPVASCNDQDFQNLMHVYMDAVFLTNIYKQEKIFRQEGWHYELDRPDGELKINGVVYNEMKGAFSSPEGVLEREILNALYPDTAYCNESGGDPEVIPTLKYSEFLAFHSKYYHPSNSYIYLYGNVDVTEKLRFLDEEYLSKYDVLPVDSEIALQKPFDQMRTVTRRYSITTEESLKENTYLSYNKSIGTSGDMKLTCAFQVLEYVLLSAPGAPLRKAILEAKIGKDVFGSYDNGTQQPMFSVIVKNSDREKLPEFTRVIETTLLGLVKNGIDRKALEAGLHYYEFRYREADYGHYPKGLMYGLTMLNTWLYDDQKPFAAIELLSVFEELKRELSGRYFEELVETYLLNNTHGAYVLIEPEQGLTARMEQELAKQLAAYKASLSQQEIHELIAQTASLKKYQEEPSAKEDLEKIPVLTRADLRREVTPLVNETFAGLPADGLKHDIFTNGIGYVSLLFDTRDVPEELFGYMGLLSATLGLIDTEHYDYGELFNEINRSTGGITANLEYLSCKDPNRPYKVYFRIATKALYDKLPVAFDMIREILGFSKLDDRKRLHEIVSEQRSRVQMFLQNSGHVAAAGRANSYISPAAYISDCAEGIGYYQLLRDLETNFDEQFETLSDNLKKLMHLIFRRDTLFVDYTGEASGEQAVAEGVSKLTDTLYDVPKTRPEPFVFHVNKKNEGIRTASKVQYVARTGNFGAAKLTYTGALRVLKVILGYDYLWNQVRVLGGAYGCMNNYARNGFGYLVSYRDPNLKRTFEVYEQAPAFIASFAPDEREMTKYIIGTLSDLDAPLGPAASGKRSMVMYLTGQTQEDLQKARDQILTASAEDIRALSAYVQAIIDEQCLCVIGSEEAINEERGLFGNVFTL